MRMNHHLVPDFGVEDEFCTPTLSRLSRPAKSSMADEEIMELLWQNGQLVMQSQNQRNQKKSSPPQLIAVVRDAEQSTSREIISSSTAAPQPDDVSATDLFIQEDEMASWLHYPLEDTSFDHDFCSDFLYSSVAPTATATTVTVELRPPVTEAPMSTKPPISPVKVLTDVDSSRLLNFGHFSRMNGRDEIEQSVSSKAVRESTIVDSSDTPVTGQDSRVSQPVRKPCEINNNGGCGGMRGADVAGTSSAGGEMTMSSAGSSGNSGCVSVSAKATQKTPLNEDRKRKVQEATNNTDCRGEDIEFEPAYLKKQVHGSTPAKRSRAAEVHNLSERKRRDRINEKLKALQELIPRCNKSDKASMLDEAIEYLKSLQLQVQMMSMGCSMVPMMPGMQQYMAAPMGMGMRMGMDMSMSMSRPMMSFPPVLACSAMPTPSAAAHIGPRFPIPGYHMQPVSPSDPSRIQVNHQANSMLNPLATQNHNLQQLPNFTNPYPRYYGLQQMTLPIPKDQATAKQGTSTPSTN